MDNVLEFAQIGCEEVYETEENEYRNMTCSDPIDCIGCSLQCFLKSENN